MSLIVDLSTEVIHKRIFELRYDLGQVYWDRAGRTAHQILSENSDWDFDEIDINHCRLSQREKNMKFNFGHSKLDYSQVQTSEVEKLDSGDEFGLAVDKLSESVINNLELQQFSRMGFRVWTLYATKDRQQSYELIDKLSLFQLNCELTEKIGNTSDVSFRLVVERPSCMVQIAISPFEQNIDISPSVIRAANARSKDYSKDQKRILIDKEKAKKQIKNYPQFGILLDLDAYIQDPPFPDHFRISDFVHQSCDDFEMIKKICLTNQKGN